MTSLKNLSSARKSVFDGIPKLSTTDRKALMVQDAKTKKITRNFKSNTNKVGFLVQRAYFQLKGRFFKPEQFRSIDIREAERSLGLKASFKQELYNEKTMYAHRQIIRDLHGWKPFGDDAKNNLSYLALIHSREQKDSEDILFALLEYCWRNKIEIPPYFILETIVLSANEKFIQKIKDKLDQVITEDQKHALFGLIDNPEIAGNLSKIKRIQQGNDQKTLLENAKILQTFKDIFFIVLPIIEELELSNHAAKELSKWIYHSNITQIRQLKDTNLLLLRLICFVKDQYYLRQDYAIDAILKKIKTTVNKARGYDRKQKESIHSEIVEANQVVVYSEKMLMVSYV